MGCNSPFSFVHGISQTRILEWVAFSFHRGSFLPRDQTHVSCIRWILFHWASTGAPELRGRGQSTKMCDFKVKRKERDRRVRKSKFHARTQGLAHAFPSVCFKWSLSIYFTYLNMYLYTHVISKRLWSCKNNMLSKLIPLLYKEFS